MIHTIILPLSKGNAFGLCKCRYCDRLSLFCGSQQAADLSEHAAKAKARSVVFQERNEGIYVGGGNHILDLEI